MKFFIIINKQTKKKMKVFLYIAFFSIIFTFINSVSHLTFKLERGEDLCLSEYFSDKTLVIYSITGVHNIQVKISDPDDKIKTQKVISFFE